MIFCEARLTQHIPLCYKEITFSGLCDLWVQVGKASGSGKR